MRYVLVEQKSLRLEKGDVLHADELYYLIGRVDKMRYVEEITMDANAVDAITNVNNLTPNQDEVYYVEELGVDGPEIFGRRATVAGYVEGIHLFNTAGFVMTDLDNAQAFLNLPPSHVTYIICKCRPTADVDKVCEELRQAYPEHDVLTTETFHEIASEYWQTNTGIGPATSVVSTGSALRASLQRDGWRHRPKLVQDAGGDRASPGRRWRCAHRSWFRCWECCSWDSDPMRVFPGEAGGSALRARARERPARR